MSLPTPHIESETNNDAKESQKQNEKSFFSNPFSKISLPTSIGDLSSTSGHLSFASPFSHFMKHKSDTSDALGETEHGENATDTFNVTQQQQPNRENNHDLADVSPSPNELSSAEDKKPEAHKPSHSGFHLPSPPALNDFSLPPSTFKVPMQSFMKQQKQHTPDDTSTSSSSLPAEGIVNDDTVDNLTSTKISNVSIIKAASSTANIPQTQQPLSQVSSAKPSTTDDPNKSKINRNIFNNMSDHLLFRKDKVKQTNQQSPIISENVYLQQSYDFERQNRHIMIVAAIIVVLWIFRPFYYLFSYLFGTPGFTSYFTGTLYYYVELIFLALSIHRILGYSFSFCLRYYLKKKIEKSDKYNIHIGWISYHGLIDRNQVVLHNIIWRNPEKFTQSPFIVHIQEIRISFQLKDMINYIRYEKAIVLDEMVISLLEVYIENINNDATTKKVINDVLNIMSGSDFNEVSSDNTTTNFNNSDKSNTYNNSNNNDNSDNKNNNKSKTDGSGNISNKAADDVSSFKRAIVNISHKVINKVKERMSGALMIPPSSSAFVATATATSNNHTGKNDDNNSNLRFDSSAERFANESTVIPIKTNNSNNITNNNNTSAPTTASSSTYPTIDLNRFILYNVKLHISDLLTVTHEEPNKKTDILLKTFHLERWDMTAPIRNKNMFLPTSMLSTTDVTTTTAPSITNTIGNNNNNNNSNNNHSNTPAVTTTSVTTASVPSCTTLTRRESVKVAFSQLPQVVVPTTMPPLSLPPLLPPKKNKKDGIPLPANLFLDKILNALIDAVMNENAASIAALLTVSSTNRANASIQSFGSNTVTGAKALGDGTVTGATYLGNTTVTGARASGDGTVTGANAFTDGTVTGANYIGNATVTGAKAFTDVTTAGFTSMGNKMATGKKSVADNLKSSLATQVHEYDAVISSLTNE